MGDDSNTFSTDSLCHMSRCSSGPRPHIHKHGPQNRHPSPRHPIRSPDPHNNAIITMNPPQNLEVRETGAYTQSLTLILLMRETEGG